MPMRFKRDWDFNQGNKAVLLNDITQDNEVRDAVLELLGTIANDAEFIRDTIAAALVAGANVTIAPNDTGNTITISSTYVNTTDPEVVRDTIGATLVAGANVTIIPNDAGDSITVSAAGASTDPEVVRDTMAAALVAGANITLTVNDAADTITIASTGGGTSGLFRGEWASDAIIDTIDFAAGAVPAAWQISHAGAGSDPDIVTIATAGKSGAPAGSSYALRCKPNNTDPANSSTAVLPMSAYPGVTRVKFWFAISNNGLSADGYVRGETMRSGNAIYSQLATGGYGWTQQTIAVVPTDNVGIRMRGNQVNGATPDCAFLAKMEVYGTASPYMSGQYVAYLGQLWRSAVNNNGSVPGADGNWVAVPLGAKAISVPTANYTLTAADAGTFIRMNVAGANTLTVPPNSSVAFPIGTVIEGAQAGAGQVTITPGAGVTINATPGLKTAAQYATFGLLKTATDTWLAYGRLSA